MGLHHAPFCQIVILLPKAICCVFHELHCATMSPMPGLSCTFLPAYSVVTVSGRDARSFLQGQLTNDLLGLERHPGLLAAACNREGRVLEILRLASRGAAVLIVVQRSLAAPLIARLEKSVLRAEVSIEDRSDALAVAGMLDAAPGGNWSQAMGAAGVTMLVAGPRRQMLVGSPLSMAAVCNDANQAASDDWERCCIEDGEPAVHPETAGNWIPQMLNLDLLSAVSFTKGCYVGQEIVARTQHLGRIKRRMLRYAGPAAAVFRPGQALYSDQSQAAQVVASCNGPRGMELLAVTELRYSGDLLGSRPGSSELVPADLPYAVPVATTAFDA
ncbi:MAG: folate-binding protein [Gammaproteobacteria bacterium]|nr:folate-binding protein [Gammaproteobacteria bacterium]